MPVGSGDTRLDCPELRTLEHLKRFMAHSIPMTEGSWAEHDRAQREAWKNTTHLERLQWLEDAKRFAFLAMKAAKKARGEE